MWSVVIGPEQTIALALGAVAAVEDLRRGRIPNWLTAAGVTGALLCAATGGWHALTRAAAGIAVGFVLFLPLYGLGAMGGGDVKLLAAFGGFLGPANIVMAVFLAAIAGALFALAMLLLSPQSRSLPYAPVIVLGAWLALLGGSS